MAVIRSMNRSDKECTALTPGDILFRHRPPTLSKIELLSIHVKCFVLILYERMNFINSVNKQIAE